MKKFFLAIIITPMLLGAAHVGVDSKISEEYILDQKISKSLNTITTDTKNMLWDCLQYNSIKIPEQKWVGNPEFVDMYSGASPLLIDPLFTTSEVQDFLSDLDDFFEPAAAPLTERQMQFDKQRCFPIKRQLAKLRNTFPKRS